MSHYEERLEQDLIQIRRRVEAVGSRVQEAVHSAVHALLSGNRDQAYQTILGDLEINRAVRVIDGLCHAFVARHLPSAGHLRFISSVLRLDIELERIGDYAVAVCREAVQLSAPPPEAIAGDLELMSDQARRMLEQALKAFNDGNAELARGAKALADQASSISHKVWCDLVREGEEDSHPLRDLFALLLILYRLDRVSDQAKNICEETLFAVTGETKPPKVYNVLFVDEKNCCQSQIAETFARKAFPGSGRYASAGWNPAEEIHPTFAAFMREHGLDLTDAEPSRLEPTHGQLAEYHVIVSLQGDPRAHIPEVPFQSILLQWDVGPEPGEDATEAVEEMYRKIAVHVEELMTALRGEGAA